MIGNSTKKIICLLMVAVISIMVFVSCGGEKVTQPSYEIVAPEETPSDNNGDGKLTTNLPIWEKNKDFSYLLDK